ncbi:3-hydroxyacyl-CoA dehydrogenase family protein [Streptomyces beigongshangae]|uniref:3-hydroxyacyl-CoA dehydrogenase family protein n=1 Tax=Streptomyces beigongshangae TaxID=2841597 RepID=UPI0027E18AE2|nr:3-hydroxyacyl-CoA dehydrogenase family protein [Streptomyces sp. REN17]
MTDTARRTDGAAGTAGVVGAGVMGVGVTQCLVTAGYTVVTVDTDPAALATAPRRLRDGLRLHRLLNPGASASAGADGSPSAAQPSSRVRWSDRLPDLADASFVVECARENPAVKEGVFRELDALCPPRTVLASCTSAIPVAGLAAVTGRADRVLGMHFMNPAPLKDTVEVITTPATSEETLDRALALLGSLGKRGVVVSDAPGFVSNRVLMLTVNEAAAVVGAGTAEAAQVDDIFQSCFGHPMGPLATADLIGLDTVLDSLDVLRQYTGDDRFQPCPLLVRLVGEGRTGRKSGAGFHDYRTSATRRSTT